MTCTAHAWTRGDSKIRLNNHFGIFAVCVCVCAAQIVHSTARIIQTTDIQTHEREKSEKKE